MSEINDKYGEYIDLCTAHFKCLLESELSRCERMKNSPPPTDFSSLPKIKIGVIYGDGIGPIITKGAERVLRHLLEGEERIEIKVIEGLTIENRLEKGVPIPEDTLEEIKTCHVLLKGPTTTPSGGKMESANVAMRRELDLFANVRPVAVPSLGIDWTFFRENTEGEYILGSKGVEIPSALAMDFKVTTDLGTERIARAAYNFARANGKKSVSIVTKSNIMKKTDGKFSEICKRVASEYPDIETDEYYIDIMCANLINEEIRSSFSVILLPNLYGDIITDEAAQIKGGVGTSGSANIGDRYAMFEAIHGSAPRLIEKGEGDYANPQSILNAASMLLSHIGFNDKASALSLAIEECEKKGIKPSVGGITCNDYCDIIIDMLKR